MTTIRGCSHARHHVRNRIGGLLRNDSLNELDEDLPLHHRGIVRPGARGDEARARRADSRADGRTKNDISLLAK